MTSPATLSDALLHHFWIQPGLLDSSLKSASSPWNPCVPEKRERVRPAKALSSHCRRSSFNPDTMLGSHVGEISSLLVPFYHWRILQDGVGCIAMAIKPTANLLEGLHASPATQSTQSTQSTKTNPSKGKHGKILKQILLRTKLLLQELHSRHHACLKHL